MLTGFCETGLIMKKETTVLHVISLIEQLTMQACQLSHIRRETPVIYLFSRIYSLILPHTGDKLSNKNKVIISLALLVTELWLKGNQYLSIKLLKIQAITSCSD